MKIDCTFVVKEGNLYSVKYHGKEHDVVFEIFEKWTDPEFLFDFFNEHISDLKSGFFGNIDINQAIERTIEAAEILEEEILQISETGRTHDYETLQSRFKSLDNNEYQLKIHQKTKLSGSEPKSWLRLYAIRIAKNFYVISGGAIKLSENMNRKHLKEELIKLDLLKEYLIDNGIYDESDYGYLEI